MWTRSFGLTAGAAAVLILTVLMFAWATNGFETKPPGGWFFDYQGLFGAMLGGGGAVFAGWIAWRAVQVQIAAETARIERRENESVEAGIDLLLPILGLISTYWRAADIALAHGTYGDSQLPEAAVLLTIATEDKPDEVALSRLEIVGPAVSPTMRIKFDVVVQFIRLFFKQVDARLRGKNAGTLRSWDAIFVRTFGSHVREACRRCHPRLAQEFDGRTVVQVNWAPLSASMNTFLNDFEESHPLPAIHAPPAQG